MLTVADHIRRRIAAEGPLTVAEYMEDALTHPHLGYYMAHDPFGPGGDFVTAPEVSQMFGELIGLWCAVQWQGMGAPDPVHLVELGPGRGTLMADALRAALGAEGFVEAATLSLVEISPVLKERQEDTLVATKGVRQVRSLNWLSDFSEVPDGPLLVIANEFFDALPVRQYVSTEDGWRERLVGLRDDGGFQFVVGETVPESGAVPAGFSDAETGAIIEVRPQADAIARAIAERLTRHVGAALIIDYGHARSASGETLQSVSSHEYADPLVEPGERDLTAHVDFGALARAARDTGAAVYGPIAQGAFLQSLGIEARAQALTATSPDHREEFAQALHRLISVDAMGRLFNVLALVSPMMPPPPGFE